MWNGTIYKNKDFTDHFDVINVKPDEILGIVSVTVVFEKSPDKEYTFEIDEDMFESDKESIGKEILRQLSE